MAANQGARGPRFDLGSILVGSGPTRLTIAAEHRELEGPRAEEMMDDGNATSSKAKQGGGADGLMVQP